jgi:hypothetical protein
MISRRVPKAPAFLLLGLTLVLALPARADFAGVPDKFRIMLGGTSADFVTEGALSVEQAGTGVTINFEELFDIPTDERSARLDGFWRFGERSYLDFGFVKFNREGSKNIEQDVTWGEFTIAEGSFVKATWDSNFPYAAYRYAFLPEEKVKISGSAGISFVGIGPKLEADGGVTGPDGPVVGHFSKEEDVAFPVPLIGLRLDWAIRDRVELMTFTRFFYLNYESIFKGGMRETALRLTWDFSKHVGVAAGYDSTSVRLKEYDTGDYKAKFTYDITGFSAYLTLAF